MYNLFRLLSPVTTFATCLITHLATITFLASMLTGLHVYLLTTTQSKILTFNNGKMTFLQYSSIYLLFM